MNRIIVLLYLLLTILIVNGQNSNRNRLFYYLPDNYPNSVEIGIKTGNEAPNICLKTIENEDVCLSDLRGKLVLIHFWSSKCAHCRGYNKALVTTYMKYNDEEFINGDGFEIFSISLDNNLNDWSHAIKEDSLAWKYQVSDHKGWATDLKVLYNFNRTPVTYLIDESGIIITKNSFGPGLDRRLHHFIKREDK